MGMDLGMGEGGMNRILSQIENSVDQFHSNLNTLPGGQSFDDFEVDYQRLMQQFQKSVDSPNQLQGKDIDQVLLQRLLQKLGQMPQTIAMSKAATEAAAHQVNSMRAAMRKMKKDLEDMKRRLPSQSQFLEGRVLKAQTDSRLG